MAVLGAMGKPCSHARPNHTLTRSQPQGASPHRLVFVTDPQLVDPHTYPGRPWPLSTLTIKHTDLYLRRAYSRIQRDLRPQTLIFLGDLFDGGREWSTESSQSAEEQWRKYDDAFWMKEYDRFSRIFFRDWISGPDSNEARSGSMNQRAQVMASLPGNHDLGFATGVQIPVRDRFSAYFGESNRVDIIGNHTFVSLDSVSLSAKELDTDGTEEEIWGPADIFLKDVKANIARTNDRYFAHLDNGTSRSFRQYPHLVKDITDTSNERAPSEHNTSAAVDFPVILLTHVPLYRSEGTPCGPLRERHPPTSPAPGQTEPVEPDSRNSIDSSGAGFQYKNVLSPELSRSIVESLDGKVDHVFSGDDHDYCEVVHRAYPSRGSGIREITVKSISWAMGVRQPGFLMTGLWHEVDEHGARLSSNGESRETLQNHLCLLPDQISILIRYGLLFGISIFLLVGRAVFVVFFQQRLNGHQREGNDGVSLLPIHNSGNVMTKEKEEDSDLASSDRRTDNESSSSILSGESIGVSNHLSARNPTSSRARSSSPLPSYGFPMGTCPPAPKPLIAYAHNASGWDRKKDDDALWSRRKRRRAQSAVHEDSKALRTVRESFKGFWVVARIVVPWYIWLLTQ